MSLRLALILLSVHPCWTQRPLNNNCLASELNGTGCNACNPLVYEFNTSDLLCQFIKIEGCKIQDEQGNCFECEEGMSAMGSEGASCVVNQSPEEN